MNKIVFKNADVNWLLTWRDEHKEEVRTAPAPVKSIQMEFPEVKKIIKCIRDGKRLRLALNENGFSKGHCDMELALNGWRLLKQKGLQQDQIQTMLTVYSSLMALMVYGAPQERSATTLPKKKRTCGKTPKHSSTAKGITYILRRSNAECSVVMKGLHRSPSGVFSVRGHYRHYKNGKVVWVNEYKKGEGNKKRKNYKIGCKPGKNEPKINDKMEVNKYEN